jgi:hypothetical protein
VVHEVKRRRRRTTSERGEVRGRWREKQRKGRRGERREAKEIQHQFAHTVAVGAADESRETLSKEEMANSIDPGYCVAYRVSKRLWCWSPGPKHKRPGPFRPFGSASRRRCCLRAVRSSARDEMSAADKSTSLLRRAPICSTDGRDDHSS